jgi:hypothetical protein
LFLLLEPLRPGLLLFYHQLCLALAQLRARGKLDVSVLAQRQLVCFAIRVRDESELCINCFHEEFVVALGKYFKRLLSGDLSVKMVTFPRHGRVLATDHVRAHISVEDA